MREREELQGVKVEDGYLAGSDNGEFGGDITFIDRDGNPPAVSNHCCPIGTDFAAFLCGCPRQAITKGTKAF